MLPSMARSLKSFDLTGNWQKFSQLLKRSSKHAAWNNKSFLTTASFLKSSAGSNLLYTENDVLEFKTYFPAIIDELTGAGKDDDFSEAKAEFSKLVNYMLPISDFSQGLKTVAAYKMLEKQERLTPENIKLANIMGWILEVNENYVVLIEDIIHQAEKRRGAPTWHMVAKKDLSTIYDGCFLQASGYALLKSHFSEHPCYLPLMHLFQDVELKNTTGQAIDDLSIKDGKINFDVFDINTYESMAQFRNGYQNFYFPVAAAMYMANIDDPELHEEAETVLLRIGTFHRMAEDYKDYFVYPKNEENIRCEGKLSWLAVSALMKSTSAQTEILKANYGKCDSQGYNAICDLYNELDMKKYFYEAKRHQFNQISNVIQNMSEKLPRDLFMKIAEGVFHQSF